ncbi:MAG TPA: tetratricopeptide repeat protein, partial [Hyphomicrobiaceae bacterium]|nr:tetratricopeptide repeat protein [Hyphomicrobiaceae bacterium]
MFRHMTIVLAGLLLGFPALAGSEEDRRECAANQSQDDRIAACSRVLEDQGANTGLRTMAYRNRGIAYTGKKLFELAVFDFDEALKLSPQDSSSLANRGWALAQMGQHDRAIADYTEFLKLSPRSDRVRNNRALALLRKGDQAAALADFEEAIRVNPRYVPARNNRGLVLARQNKLDEAIAEYSEALKIDPEYLLAYNNRARAYEAKGDVQAALADFKQAAEREGLNRHDEDARAKATAKQQVERLTKAVAEGKAAPRPGAERRVALVIGNSAYAHAPALRNPVNDAKAFAAVLRAIGFTEVRELYDASLPTLGSTLKSFGDLAAGADWAVIYYAGHGIEVNGTNYLIPVDAILEQAAHVEDEAMPLSRLLSKVTAASKLQLVILDACRNNPFTGRMKRSGQAGR